MAFHIICCGRLYLPKMAGTPSLISEAHFDKWSLSSVPGNLGQLLWLPWALNTLRLVKNISTLCSWNSGFQNQTQCYQEVHEEVPQRSRGPRATVPADGWARRGSTSRTHSHGCSQHFVLWTVGLRASFPHWLLDGGFLYSPFYIGLSIAQLKIWPLPSLRESVWKREWELGYYMFLLLLLLFIC